MLTAALPIFPERGPAAATRQHNDAESVRQNEPALASLIVSA